MQLTKSGTRLLGLNTNEIKVLNALREGLSTPLEIANTTKISRPAVYEILERLHKRRLITSSTRKGKKYWSQAKEQVIEHELYNTKKQLLDLAGGVQEIFGVSDSTIFLHRGGEAVQEVLDSLVREHSSQRIHMLSGDSQQMIDGWNRYYGEDRVHEFNRAVKKNKLITELILTQRWFDTQRQKFGLKWAKELEGRTAVAHRIDEKYLNSAGQIFIFKNSIYFISMREALIIEVKNSEIQKLILSMFSFMQDNAEKFNLNEELRQIVEGGVKSTAGAAIDGGDVAAAETYDRFDSTVLVHKGAESIRELIRDIMQDREGQTLYGIQGDLVGEGWNKIFGIEGVNEMNRLLKANNISVEAIVPVGWVERQTRVMGLEWAKDFEGRIAPNSHEIEKEYFDHGGQIFIFKNSVYLLSMNEEVVIEIRNSEIQKLILSMFQFIQDHGSKFDINARLQKHIQKVG